MKNGVENKKVIKMSEASPNIKGFNKKNAQIELLVNIPQESNIS